MNVVIMESLGIPAEELAGLQKPFEEKGWSFTSYERTGDEQKLIEEAKGADIMVLANMPMPASVIAACEDLKYIDIAFTGVDHVGLEAARERNIAVSNASGYSNEAVAELVLGLALSLYRSIPKADERCRAGQTKAELTAREIKGKTVGIIGYGKIGSRTGELFHAFGAKVLAQSRSVHSDYPEYVEQVSQEELLQRSDLVILHCPLNESTRGMIGAAQLAMMKPDAYLINAARGPVTDEQALADALNNGVIAGAAIDVFTKEPPLDTATQLLHAKNTLVTPHLAFATEESMSLRAQIVFENMAAWAEGKQKNIVK